LTRNSAKRLLLLAIQVLLLQFLFVPYGRAQAPDSLNSKDQELEICRAYIPKLVSDLNAQKAACPTDPSFQAYLSKYYDHAAALEQARVDLYKWQLTVGNVLLYTVVILVFGGFLITLFQVYQLYRLNQMSEVTLQVSFRNLQITTSITGIAVLALSFMFVVAFLHEVYQIRPLTQAASEAARATEK